MKKIKQILSCVLTAAMLTAPVNAAETVSYEGNTELVPQNWDIRYLTNRTAWNTEQDYSAVTTGERYSGEAGLCVNIESPKEDSRYIRVQNTLSEPLEADQTYRIAFWYKGTGANFSTCFDWSYRKGFNDYSIEKTDGDWKYYYIDIPVTTVPNSVLTMLFENKMNCVLDDISVKKVTADGENVSLGNELIRNNSFETYAVKTEFDVKNEAYKSNSWGMDYNTAVQKDMDFSVDYAKPTKKYSRTGEYAMYINFASAKKSDWYFMIKNPVKPVLKAGTYGIEFWAKGYFAADSVLAGLFWGNGVHEAIGKMTISEPDENGWSRYYKEFTMSADDTARDFWLLVQNTCSGVIDDIKLFNTSTPDVNILKDGGFEECQALPQAENKYITSNWGVSANGVGDNMWNKDIFIEASQKDAYSGSYSLHAAFPSVKSFNNRYAKLMQSYEAGHFPAGNYHLSFYAKGNYTLFQIGIGWGEAFKGTNNAVFTATEDRDGWKRYDADLTLNSAQSYFQIIVDRTTYDLFIDDIVLTAEGSDENLVANGGFELNKERENTTSLINPIAYAAEAGNAVNISWTNPYNYLIDSIKVYINGKENKNTVINTKPSAFNEFLIDGLNNYQEYTIKLVTTIDGVEYEDVLTVIPDDMKQALTMGDWNIYRRDTVINKLTYYSNFNASLDNNEKVSGKASLRIDANLPVKRSNIYPNVNQSVNLHTSKKYRLVFKAKTEGVNHLYLIEDTHVQTGSGEKYHFWYSPDFIRQENAVTSDWVTYSQDLTPTEDIDGKYFELYNTLEDDIEYSANIKIAADWMTGSLWLDDIGVYEVDPYTDEIISENLLNNGGFDYSAYEVEEPEYSLVVGEEKFDTTVLETGNMQVTAKIKNYSAGDKFSAMIGVALYNGSNLVSMTTMEKNIAQLPSYIPADEFTANVTVPELDTGDYKLKVIYWDGMSTMKPLDIPDVLTPSGVQ